MHKTYRKNYTFALKDFVLHTILKYHMDSFKSRHYKQGTALNINLTSTFIQTFSVLQ